MPIGGSATEFNITGAKLKVSGGVQVTGSIAYTTDATGFGGVTAQIDGNNTLNITSGKLTGVTKIERSTAATINAITHTNVNNNTTIHIALKNTSSTRGNFITLETFASDDTVKVNYTDDYIIGPGETGMITLRKVNNVLSLFVREMFSDKASTFTEDATDGNRPFYIKDGVNYKYPLYKYSIGGSDLTSIVIQGTTYFRPSSGITTKSRPPKGIPENVTPPSASGFNIGNNGAMTTVEYSVLGVSSSFDFGSITDNGGTTHTRFLLTDGEASGTFTESGASSGDSYKLFIEKTNTNLTDTVVTTVQNNVTQTIAFHHGPFSASDYSSAYSTVEAAATAGFVYSDTVAGDYTWGILGTPSFSNALKNTTYTYTSHSELTGADVLMVAGGGGGGGHVSGGGGAGGLLHHTNQTFSGQKTIVIGGGGVGGNSASTPKAGEGKNTTFTSFSNAIGGGAASGYNPTVSGTVGGSGGGGGHGASGGAGTVGQGFAGANSASHSHSGGGGGAGGAGTNAHGGVGGVGLDKSSVFGTTYGESGWFAGGGGGGARTTGVDGPGGQGGGGDGKQASNVDGDSGTKHTGGGGGGNGTGSGTSGAGGSGIVIIKFTGDKVSYIKTIPKITGISNVTTADSKTINYTFNTQGTGIDKITYKIGSGSEVSTASGVYTLAYTPADFGTTVLTYAYPINSSSTKIAPNFGPYSVTTTLSIKEPGVKRWKHIPPNSNGTTTNWAALDTWIPVMHTYGTPTPTIVSTSVCESADNYWYIYAGWVESSSTRTYALTCNADDDFYFWSGDTALDENRSALTYTNAVCYKRYINSPSGASGGNLSLTANIKVPIRMMFGELTGGENWSLNFDSVAVHSNLISTTVGSDTIKFSYAV
jgi:hypothetical protein